MQVSINGHEIDFALEAEKNASDVISSINAWANERGLILCNVSADGVNIDIDSTLSIDTINKIEFNIQSRADLVIDTLNEVGAYCDKILRFIANDKIKTTSSDDLSGGLDWLVDVFSHVFLLLQTDCDKINYLGKPISHYLKNLKEIAVSTREKGNVEFVTKTDLFNDIKKISKIILTCDNMRDLISKSIDSPDTLISAIESIKADAPTQISLLEEISALYQSGKDADASEKLQQFVDFIYGYIRLSYQIKPIFNLNLDDIIVSSESMQSINDNINTLLNEVATVLENNDIISLSDLLEYELMPQIEKIPLVIEELSAFLAKKQ